MILFLSRISRMPRAIGVATPLVYARVAPGAVEGEPADAGTAPAPPSDKEELQAKQLSNSEDDIALAKSGRLLRYGVTGGVAVTLQVPFAASHGARMETAAAGTAPCIEILPAF